MRDNGTVVSTQGSLAQVRVECVPGCRECSASSFCKGAGQKEGLLSVRNPVRAHPGDEVAIEVPERRYHRALIVMFSGLLAASLLGAGAGAWLSGPLSLDSALSAPLGFFLGLGLAVPALALYFRRNNRRLLYPWITDIIHEKGERHG
jgi:positive regulator of sigma E activity